MQLLAIGSKQLSIVEERKETVEQLSSAITKLHLPVVLVQYFKTAELPILLVFVGSRKFNQTPSDPTEMQPNFAYTLLVDTFFYILFSVIINNNQ